MCNRKTILFLAGLVLAGSIIAGAEEKFGIKVYDGAKYCASTSKTVSESLSINASCYRTNDKIKSVIAFYKKQPGLNSLSETAESAMFRKGNIDITIQNPWMDMKTGKLMNDTLISIVKN